MRRWVNTHSWLQKVRNETWNQSIQAGLPPLHLCWNVESLRGTLRLIIPADVESGLIRTIRNFQTKGCTPKPSVSAGKSGCPFLGIFVGTFLEQTVLLWHHCSSTIPLNSENFLLGCLICGHWGNKMRCYGQPSEKTPATLNKKRELSGWCDLRQVVDGVIPEIVSWASQIFGASVFRGSDQPCFLHEEQIKSSLVQPD